MPSFTRADVCEPGETHTENGCSYTCERLYGVDGTPSFATWGACVPIETGVATESGTGTFGSTSTVTSTNAKPTTKSAGSSGTPPPGSQRSRGSISSSSLEQQKSFCQVATVNYFGIAVALKAGKRDGSQAVAAAANESIRRAQLLGSDCPVRNEDGGERFWTEETHPLPQAKKTNGVEPKIIMEYVHELASQKTLPATARSVAGLAAKLGIRENEPFSAGESADAETHIVASQNEQASEAAETREGNAVNSFADAAADAQVAQSPPAKPTTPVRSDRDLGELELIMRDVAALRLSSDRLDARLAEISIFKRVNRTYRNHEPQLSKPLLNLR